MGKIIIILLFVKANIKNYKSNYGYISWSGNAILHLIETLTNFQGYIIRWYMSVKKMKKLCLWRANFYAISIGGQKWGSSHLTWYFDALAHREIKGGAKKTFEVWQKGTGLDCVDVLRMNTNE